MGVTMMWMLKDSDANGYYSLKLWKDIQTYTQSKFGGRFSTRYQFSPITSRTTTYILFVFWCFFFFFGEFLLLVLFNFNTISDTIPSSYFISTKNHVVFWLNVEGRLGEIVMIYICIFSFCSLNFLLRLDLDSSYHRFYREEGLDILFSLFIFMVFQSYW